MPWRGMAGELPSLLQLARRGSAPAAVLVAQTGVCHQNFYGSATGAVDAGGSGLLPI